MSNLSPFIKLVDPQTYEACWIDLAVDASWRNHWLGVFRRLFPTLVKHGTEIALALGDAPDDVAARAHAAQQWLGARLDDFAAHPTKYGRVTILTLDDWRDNCLRRYGFADPFIDLKNRENQKMLPLLPVICRELDGLSGEQQLRAIIEGVFAGNIFDMGIEATANAFRDKSPDFDAVRARLPQRPWLIDDYDLLADRLLNGPPHRKAVFFIDNAGSDFMLGALPMMRWLARRGTNVIIAANEQPTLNDMTIHDVNAWWPRIVATEPTFGDLPIQRISTGTDAPLIDLKKVSQELNAAAHDADLVILEGMGRGVESNLYADLSCDCLNIAMLKDAHTAEHLGGKVFDVVCRFVPC